ncbi:DUF2834 domain-containing protein [Lacinutrix jangbogonensis]|uniref:DUF2834 domain-containing protein n=1 Tax=Lacinutrix jangbogonensis TaxID=1469557 RepID=UPI00053E8881|nr:DUF2834 domain-containing protein [Lacinutrix jangbogonensis]
MKYKYVYLIIAILGLAYTWYFNIQFYQTAEDTSIAIFIAQAKTTFPAKSITADITVVLFAFFTWYIPDALKLKVKYWWALIPLTFLVAIAFTFPMYLFMRKNKLDKIKSNQK